MTYVLRQFSFCAGRVEILTIRRSFVSTPICLIRGKLGSGPNRIRKSRNSGQLLKDSDIVNTEEDVDQLDLNMGHLEQDYNKELKKAKNQLWKILTKKNMEKPAKKAPNMLTTSEREHIIYLHNSDPEYWTAEQLSESFPALPYVIRKILKRKWTPETQEKMREMDAKVLNNWEKLKRNELEAEPAVLKHLKKFINRQLTLPGQMVNPEFLPKPPVPKHVTWKEGPLTKILTRYEKEIEKLKSKSTGHEMLPGSSNGEVAINNERRISIVEEIKMEVEARETEDDSFVIGKLKRTDNEMTLEEMKTSILEKTESKKPLSKFDELVLNKTLSGGEKERKGEIKNENQNNESFNDESGVKKLNRINNQKLLANILRKTPKERTFKSRTGDSPEKKPLPKLERNKVTDEDLLEDKTHYLNDMNLGLFLNSTEDEKKEPEQCIQVTKPKTSVNYYATEKDKEMMERDVELLKGSSFWAPPDNRSEPPSTGRVSSVSNNSSPHLSATVKTYFTYDYPDNIDIPSDKWIKGKIYRVKDCYYDDDGEFLYRVPGIKPN